MGRYLIGINDSQSALSYLDEAYEISHQSGENEIAAGFLGNKSIALLGLKRFREAEDALCNVAAIAEEENNNSLRVDAILQKASLFLDESRGDLAKEELEKALPIAKELGGSASTDADICFDWTFAPFTCLV